MDLLLIRHGQSEANQRGLLISTDQDGLTPLGQSQSDQLRRTLKSMAIAPTKVVCSPWARARQTAERLFDDVSGIQFDARLAETHPGRFGSWLEADFNRAYPDFNRDIRNRYEEGESHRDMADRVCEWVDETILATTAMDGLLVAVAHGGPISIILQYLLGVPIDERYPTFTVPNASLTQLKYRRDLGRYCMERAGQI